MASELNAIIFDDFIKEGITVVDFFADWCAPCKMAAPILGEVEEYYGEKIHVGKVNIDENRELAVRYTVESIPAIVIFKNGYEAERIIGLRTFDEYCDAVNGVL